MTILNATRLTALVLGLAIACCCISQEAAACTVQQAKDAIAAAKTENEKAKAANNEWRDTAKIIANAEKALADGYCDKALQLAHQAYQQAENAIAQAQEEQQGLEQWQAQHRRVDRRVEPLNPSIRGHPQVGNAGGRKQQVERPVKVLNPSLRVH
ncbi:MAG TPA: hypothetical protein VNH42_08470 [Mariprofundaceae bacterium]|nr:hypothetical protein [Mariprofundaceae bacterium]